MTECSICCGKYNKTKNTKVTCFGCDYESCRECLSRYLLDPATTTPNCPNCHKEWTREFLLKSFTQKFVNTDMKQHREEVLFQREKALLPTRQAEAERRNNLASLCAQIRAIEQQINQLGVRRSELQQQIYEASKGGPQLVRNEFIQPCPNTDCRGFLSTQWKCGLCKQWSCKDCHEVKGPEQTSSHTCDPDKVESAKLIAKETKPCPKCGVRLFKISGCNQMWCTACNDCAFDWVTGKIETTIHNPHYFEYRRRLTGGEIPRQPGDIPGGGEGAACGFDDLTTLSVNRILAPYSRQSKEIEYNMRLVDEILRMSVHIRHALIPRYTIDPVRYNEEYGISYLMGEITESEFKTKLQRADKKYQMSHEIRNVLQMSSVTLESIVGRFKESLELTEPDKLSVRLLAAKGIKVEQLLDILKDKFPILPESKTLLDYANECFEKIATIYGSKSPVKLLLNF